MKQLHLPSEIVKKDNSLMRGKLSINNLDSSRLLASLIAQIPSYETDFQEQYTLKANAFMSNTSGKIYAHIAKVCEDLAGATAKILRPSQNRKEPSFRVYTFFKYIDYDNGMITAKFNDEMKDLLLNLRSCFAQYNLLDYLMLPSAYSQKVFEILCSVSGLPEHTIPLAELHEILATPPSFRDNFKAFRIRVLEKSYKDIHEHTPLKFEWLPIKSGRSVEAIKFVFSEVRQAITSKENKKADDAKQRRLASKRMGTALDCCAKKQGKCTSQDNKAIICKMCIQFDMCGDYIRRDGKPFDPYTSYKIK